MKNLWLVLLAVFLFGCQGSVNTSSNPSQADKNAQFWEGNINKNIPVFLWFNVAPDNTLFGELDYKKSKQHNDIYLVGHYGSVITISEFDRKGNATGAWEGKIINGKFTGKWMSLNSEKEMPFELEQAHIQFHSEQADFTNPPNINGTYSYSLPCEASGVVNIKQLGKDKVIFNVSCVTCAPAYNIAEMDDDTVDFKSNMASYTSQDENGKCSFTIRFYKQFLTIDYACDTCISCGFGLNAEVSGTYIKTSSKPVMGQNIY